VLPAGVEGLVGLVGLVEGLVEGSVGLLPQATMDRTIVKASSSAISFFIKIFSLNTNYFQSFSSKTRILCSFLSVFRLQNSRVAL
jgi:hypothetical protein